MSKLNEFLEWEKKSESIHLKYKGFPIWSFIRLELFQIYALSDTEIEVFTKNSSKEKRISVSINLKQLIINSISGLIKTLTKKTEILLISQAFKRKKIGHLYYDIIFDKTIQEINRPYSLIELPDFTKKKLHPSPSINQKEIINGDFLYLFEKLLLVNKKLLNEIIKNILFEFSKFYNQHNDIEINEAKFLYEIEHRLYRNCRRIPIYKYLLRIISPKVVVLWSAYTPMNQILIYNAKKLGIKIIELQHGHIYSEHIGYAQSKEKNYNSQFPDYIFCYNSYYKNLLINSGWRQNSVKLAGNFLLNNELLKDTTKRDKKILDEIVYLSSGRPIITIICQHTMNKEVVSFFRHIRKYVNIFFIFKLHPMYTEMQKTAFEAILNDNNSMLIDQIPLELVLEKSQGVAGYYSTGLIDALRIGIRQVFILPSKTDYFFQDFIDNMYFHKVSNLKNLIELLAKPYYKKKDFEYDPFNISFIYDIL